MKKIIVLNITDSGGFFSIQVVFWFAVTGTPVPKTNAVSAYSKISGPELSQISSGAVIEEQYTFQAPHGSTNLQLQTILSGLYNARAAWLAAQLPSNQYYGVSWDGTTWA